MPQIAVECPDCRGTGLYSGMCEGDGVAVICLSCEGKGLKFLHYNKFTHRKRKNGIKHVRHSRGMSILLGCGPTGEELTYAEFKQKVPVNFPG